MKIRLLKATEHRPADNRVSNGGGCSFTCFGSAVLRLGRTPGESFVTQLASHLSHQTFQHQLLHLERKKLVLWCRGGVPVCPSTAELQPEGLPYGGDQEAFDKRFLLN